LADKNLINLATNTKIGDDQSDINNYAINQQNGVGKFDIVFNK